MKKTLAVILVASLLLGTAFAALACSGPVWLPPSTGTSRAEALHSYE